MNTSLPLVDYIPFVVFILSTILYNFLFTNSPLINVGIFFFFFYLKNVFLHFTSVDFLGGLRLTHLKLLHMSVGITHLIKANKLNMNFELVKLNVILYEILRIVVANLTLQSLEKSSADL